MTCPSRPRPRRWVALVGLLALGLLSLGLAACSSTDEETPTASSEETSASATPTEPPPAPPETWPLSGLEVPAGKVASLDHPVIVLKLDNTEASAPQVGLGRADLVIEELVEGGLTRLAAFFYTTIPGDVGPVRSMRASDIGIVTPVDASVVTSGAASVTIERIREAGIRYFNEGSKGFFRDSSRSAPYNLFTNLRQTTSLTTSPPQRPQDYFIWGDPATLPLGRAASSVVADFGAHSTQWSYRDGTYVNDNSYAAEGDVFAPDTVLALRVEIGDAGYLDPAGNPVPETELVGEGSAEIFHGGRRIKAQWSKADESAPIELTKRGVAITMPSGKTWVELVPAESGDVTWAP